MPTKKMSSSSWAEVNLVRWREGQLPRWAVGRGSNLVGSVKNMCFASAAAESPVVGMELDGANIHIAYVGERRTSA